MKTDVDVYDGHVLESTMDGDELVHDVHHPPYCGEPDPVYGYNCAIAFVTDNIGDEPWNAADTPGWRVVGWRHDTYSTEGGTEHDVVCWALPETFEP